MGYVLREQILIKLTVEPLQVYQAFFICVNTEGVFKY